MLDHFDISEPLHTTVVANRVESRLQRQRTCLGLANQGRLQLKHEEMTRELLGQEAARCCTARPGIRREVRCEHRQWKRALTVVTWNVRTMVEDVGDVRICRKCCRKHDASNDSQSVNCKLDLLIKELKRYGVSVAGIQESKWFGKEVWSAEGYTFLHSGHPLPIAGDRGLRNKGVGIALDAIATAAWKEAVLGKQ